ncbi:hypothetical protein JMJ77_0002533 [Colletotrichum scovillei]|uniref:Uncharacterized protein n=1 Tax=Colletotrichum scovillei TaxID=1209932 RepID=A0A9P7UEA2_9PEZI|nr:hypothetical protein JMJ77_0002533 [Colletotrichum scovillei]KAG7070955.1 hypothetical protein JMJ76_0002196 [Colletotrichum scovillei]
MLQEILFLDKAFTIKGLPIAGTCWTLLLACWVKTQKNWYIRGVLHLRSQNQLVTGSQRASE